MKKRLWIALLIMLVTLPSISFAQEGDENEGVLTPDNILEIERVAEFSPDDDALTAVMFSPDSQMVLTGSESGTAYLWQARSGELLHSFAGEFSAAGISFVGDGTRLVAAAGDTLTLFDAVSGEFLLELEGHEADIATVMRGPGGRTFISVDGDDVMRVWSVETGELLHVLSRENCGVSAVAYTRDGAQIAAGSAEGNICIWDASTGEMVAELTGHTATILHLIFNSDSSELISIAADGVVLRWRGSGGEAETVLELPAEGLTAVQPSPTLGTLLWGSESGELGLEILLEVQRLPVLWGHEGAVNSVAYHPRGNLMATSSEADFLMFWSFLASGAQVMIEGSYLGGTWSPDGRLYAAVDADGVAHVFGLPEGEGADSGESVEAEANESTEVGEGTYYFPPLENPDSVPVGLEPGQLAPDFSLETLEGESIRLSELRDQVVLVNFWATWCGPCRVEMPEFEEVYQAEKERGFTVLAVNVTTTEPEMSAVREFVADGEFSYPILLDVIHQVNERYQVRTYPQSVLIDGNGVIVANVAGVITGEWLYEHLDMFEVR